MYKLKSDQKMESYIFGYDLNVIHHSVIVTKKKKKKEIEKALRSFMLSKQPPFPANVRPKEISGTSGEFLKTAKHRRC